MILSFHVFSTHLIKKSQKNLSNGQVGVQLLQPRLWLQMKSWEMLAPPISKVFIGFVRYASCIFIYVTDSESHRCLTSGRRGKSWHHRANSLFSERLLAARRVQRENVLMQLWAHCNCRASPVGALQCQLTLHSSGATSWSSLHDCCLNSPEHRMKGMRGLLLAGHQRNHTCRHFNLFSPQLATFWHCVTPPSCLILMYNVPRFHLRDRQWQPFLQTRPEGSKDGHHVLQRL